MNFQWILIAIFVASLLSGIVKAMFRPMLKNVLRLVCVPVAFLLTFILQALGLFQLIMTKAVALANLASYIPGMESLVEVLIAFCSTLLSPILFVSVFFLILWFLRILHVNLIAKFIQKRIEKVEKEELKLEIKAEKKRVKESIRENEKLLEEAEQNEGEKSVEAIIAENYKAPDDDEIEKMVEERVEREKKAQKKAGFFRESSEKKAISVVSGAVSAFLVLGISLMPVFYTMSVLSSATDGIRNSDADDSMIYQTVEVFDNHFVEPYEESFVAQLYRSLGLEDLMNSTVRLGGRLVLDDGRVVYVDDVMKTFLTHGVSAAAQLTSGKSSQENLPEDIGVLTTDPFVSSVLADTIHVLMQDVETPAVSGEDDIVGGLAAGIVDHYKTVDAATISNDLGAIGDTLVVFVDSGLLNTLMSGGEFDPNTLISDKELLGDLLSSMSGLSVFAPVVSTAFTSGIDMLGSVLQIPADDAEAYDILMEHIYESVTGDTVASFNMTSVKNFVKNCAASGKKANNYASTDPEGYANFLAYYAHWTKVQMAFASGSEDLSLGYFTLEVEGTTYMYDSSKRTFSAIDVASDENAKKVSPIRDLIHYLAQNSSTTMTVEGLNTLLAGFEGSEDGKAVATRLLDKENFVSKAVTVEKMQASTEFDDWTEEEKEKDGRLCAEIISSLLGLMSNFESAGSGSSDMNAMLDQFEVLGKTMDLMAETSCLKELPPLLLEGLVKNDMFSQYITPSIVNQINETVQNDPDICYADYMKSLASTIKILIDSIGGI